MKTIFESIVILLFGSIFLVACSEKKEKTVEQKAEIFGKPSGNTLASDNISFAN